MCGIVEQLSCYNKLLHPFYTFIYNCYTHGVEVGRKSFPLICIFKLETKNFDFRNNQMQCLE